MRTFLVLEINDEGVQATASYQGENLNSILPKLLEDEFVGPTEFFESVEDLKKHLTNDNYMDCDSCSLFEFLDITDPMKVTPVFDWEYNDG